MSGLNLRPLLPAPRGPSTDDENTNTSDSNPSRRQNSGACDRCRSQKSRCDRARPKCGLCVKRQVTCFYSADVKKQSLEVHKQQGELLHMMRTAPEEEALDILFRLRATADPQAVLESSRGNMSRRYQPSAIETAQSVSTATFSGLEFELAMRHPLPYPPVPPVDTGSVDLKLLPGDASRNMSPSRFDSRQSSASSMTEDLYDARLRHLDISYWTTVPISNIVAAKIISSYLQTHHPIWGLFHADLFVRDLVEMRLEFCSSFLVNALLCYACVYGVTDPNLPALSVPFAQATAALWRAEQSTNSVLNVAAILMFSLCCHTTNCGVTVAELMMDGRRMAEQLELFGRQESCVVQSSFDALTEEWKMATAHIAWGAYSWMTINLYHTPSVTPIDRQPPFPLPSPQAGTFASFCQLWTIMQEIALVGRRGTEGSAYAGIPLAVAEAKFQKLLHWADGLDPAMTPSPTCSDPVVVFHMMFHCAVLDLFLPFCSGAALRRRLRSFSARDCSVESICRASTNQLKRLLLECRQRRHRVLTSLCTAAFIRVSNAMLRDGARSRTVRGKMSSSLYVDPEWRFYFLLCVANCRDMLLCFNLAAPILRGLLAMAMQKGVMSPAEAQAAMAMLEAEASRHAAKMLRDDFGEVLLDFDSGATRPAESSQTGQVSTRYDELVAFNEFTINQDFSQGGLG